MSNVFERYTYGEYHGLCYVVDFNTLHRVRLAADQVKVDGVTFFSNAQLGIYCSFRLVQDKTPLDYPLFSAGMQGNLFLLGLKEFNKYILLNLNGQDGQYSLCHTYIVTGMTSMNRRVDVSLQYIYKSVSKYYIMLKVTWEWSELTIIIQLEVECKTGNLRVRSKRVFGSRAGVFSDWDDTVKLLTLPQVFMGV